MLKQCPYSCSSMLKVPPPWQCPSSAPVPPQGAPGGYGQFGAPREEAGPLGAQLLPRVLELAASKPADFTAFDPAGAPSVTTWLTPTPTPTPTLTLTRNRSPNPSSNPNPNPNQAARARPWGPC